MKDSLFDKFTLRKNGHEKKVQLYPVLLDSLLKDYLWGGTALRTEFGKSGNNERIAESWELSCHKDGQSVIRNGKYQGKTLAQYIADSGASVTGTACEGFGRFPLLIKLISSADRLSVQVHPSDEHTRGLENESGKNEMWYFISCESDAEIVYGVEHSLTRGELAGHIKDNTLMHALHKVSVKAGDVFFINAGTIHSLGKGILAIEIQQNSNITYRLYDYDRKDSNGNSRQLHVDKALEVSILEPSVPCPAYPERVHDGWRSRKLVECDDFVTELCNIDICAFFSADDRSFHAFFALEGSGKIFSKACSIVRFKKGDTFFIPAGLGLYRIEGSCTLIHTNIP